MAAEISEGAGRDYRLSPAVGLGATTLEESGTLVQQPRLEHVQDPLAVVVGTAGGRPCVGVAGRASRPEDAGAILHPRRQTSAYLAR